MRESNANERAPKAARLIGLKIYYGWTGVDDDDYFSSLTFLMRNGGDFVVIIFAMPIFCIYAWQK